MVKCKTCWDKKYVGLKREECLCGELPDDRPCPDCSVKPAPEPVQAVVVPPPPNTIDLGTCTRISQLRYHLQMQARKVNDKMQDIMIRDFLVGVAQKKTTVDLEEKYLLSFFPHGSATVEQIIQHGKSLGLKPGPVEMAPQYHLQRNVRRPSTAIIFGVDPIFFAGKQWCFIITDNNEGRVLRAVQADSHICGQTKWSFLNPSQISVIWLK
jgi:hypothetical protein